MPSQPTPETPARSSRRVFLRRTALVMAGGLATAAGIKGYSLARNGILSSGGPFTELDWRQVEANASDISWARVARDPHAGSLPSSWHKIGILLTPRAALDALQEEHRGVQAVAYADPGDHVHVGFEPDGQSIFGPDPSDTGQYAVGMRVGQGELRAVQGVWVDEASLFLRAATHTMPRTTTPDAMSHEFPGVVYV